MVFSSLPIYLDPPNWNQQTTSHQPPGGAAINQPPQHPSLMADPPPHPAGLPGPTRPVSMAERARLAKIPQPEPALKCPRCDSINTKFCYFNNYSLSQPRHFCKTCRRYWTRGGALRNVPVGGGCRRNKRTKAGPASSKTAFSTGASSSTASASMNLTTMLPPPPPPPQLPFMAHFQPLHDYSATNIGLGFAGIHPLDSVDYQIGSGGGGGGAGLEQWRMQQFPFMGGLDASPAAPATVAGLFPFDGEGGGNDHQGFSTGRMLTKASSSGLISQMASVKMEDSSHGINLQRQYMGAVAGNEQYWDGNGDGGGSAGNGGGCGWLGDLSGFNSSSSGNIL